MYVITEQNLTGKGFDRKVGVSQQVVVKAGVIAGYLVVPQPNTLLYTVGLLGFVDYSLQWEHESVLRCSVLAPY